MIDYQAEQITKLFLLNTRLIEIKWQNKHEIMKCNLLNGSSNIHCQHLFKTCMLDCPPCMIFYPPNCAMYVSWGWLKLAI